MKMLEIDWRDFIHAAELYQRLPVGARAFFVETVMPKQAVTNALMGEWREALLHSGLMVSGVQGKNASVDPRRGHFNRVMRSLRRYPILESPSRETFRDFVVEHLEDAELRALSEKNNYYRNYDGTTELYSRVCSAAWVKGFLAAKDPDWEKKFRVAGGTVYFPSADILKASQALVRKLGAEPVPMARLPGLCPELRPDLLAAAIRAGIRYLLFFPSLWGAELDVVLGLWPTVARKLGGASSKAPEPLPRPTNFSRRSSWKT